MNHELMIAFILYTNKTLFHRLQLVSIFSRWRRLQVCTRRLMSSSTQRWFETDKKMTGLLMTVSLHALYPLQEYVFDWVV